MENRRKTLVINKKFQYQYGLLAVSLTVLVANVFILIAILLPNSTSISIGAGQALGIGLFELLLISAVRYASIRFSLKVAGPVYVFNRQIQSFCAGDLSSSVKLRKSDLFQSEAAEINRSLALLADHIKRIDIAAQSVLDGSEEADRESLLTELRGFREVGD